MRLNAWHKILNHYLVLLLAGGQPVPASLIFPYFLLSCPCLIGLRYSGLLSSSGQRTLLGPLPLSTKSKFTAAEGVSWTSFNHATSSNILFSTQFFSNASSSTPSPPYLQSNFSLLITYHTVRAPFGSFYQLHLISSSLASNLSQNPLDDLSDCHYTIVRKLPGRSPPLTISNYPSTPNYLALPFSLFPH